MRNRSFAGVSYQHALRTSVYGEVYQGKTTAGQAATVLDVDDRLSRFPGFADALTERSDLVKKLSHPNVESIRAAGRAPDGHLAIVSEPLTGAMALDELLQSVRPAPLPQNVGAAIASGICAGLAAAHRAGIAHGAMHPRSVLITREGVIKISDLTIGHTLVTKARPAVTDALRGYMAPEISLGGAPTPSADVYAAAVLIYAMLTGETQPGKSTIAPATDEVLTRALSREASRRYADADEFFRRLGDAFQRDGITCASGIDLAQYLKSIQGKANTVFDDLRDSSEQSGDSEDPLAVLGSKKKTGAVTPLPALQQRIDSVLSELEPPTQVDLLPSAQEKRDPIAELIALAELEFQNETSHSSDSQDSSVDTVQRSRHEIAALAAIASLDGDAPSASHDASKSDLARSDTELAAVQDDDDQEDDGVVTSAARYEKSGHSSPTLRPAPEVPKAAARSASPASSSPASSNPASPSPGQNAASSSRRPDAAASSRSLDAAAASSRSLDAAAGVSTSRLDAAASSSRLDTAASSPGLRRVQAPSPSAGNAPARPSAPPARNAIDDAADDDVSPDDLGKKSSFLKNAFWAVFAVSAIAVLVWVIRSQTSLLKQAEEQKERDRIEAEAQLKAFNDSQPKPGRMAIESEPDEAAVWMLVGRTPTTTAQLPTEMLHELRIELDGHIPKDIRVTGDRWSGSGDEQIANMEVTLTPGTPEKPLPAYPPAPPEGTTGKADGKGYITIKSEPTGAQVWLLVGITPGVELGGIAGQPYELKVLKDGHVPAFVSISANDWKSQGDKNEVSKSVTLDKVGKRRRDK